MFAEQVYKPPRTHFHIDKEASVVLGSGTDGGGLQHSVQRFPRFWTVLRYHPQQQLSHAAGGFYWRFERALSPHFFVSLVFRDKSVDDIFQKIRPRAFLNAIVRAASCR